MEDPFYSQLLERSAVKSASHQRKFLARRHLMFADFDDKMLFQSDLSDFAAIVISPDFAFLHIWKCGGSTVTSMLPGVDQVSLNNMDVQERSWVTTVRDPIDRFLSAWAECGYRQLDNNWTGEYDKLNHPSVLDWIHGEYDFRVRAFLNEVKQYTYPAPILSCHTHAHPQANAMMNTGRRIDDRIKIVGDLEELTTVLDLANFEDTKEGIRDRTAATNQIKTGLFPKKREDLKDDTLLELCEYYALDYYLFDFEPPLICVQPGGPLARFFL